jgi:phage/plasmid-like protein (TIGR03299 family)
MAHELDFTLGKAAIAYTGTTPWHGYGERLNGDETLEQWITQAGMDYTVKESPVFHNKYITTDDEASSRRLAARNFLSFKPVPGKKILTRSDTDGVLSVVGSNYKVVQPQEVMEFFRDLIDDQGFKMHTAGVLADGNRVWALAETGKDFTLNEDKVGGYLLLATSYDGKFSTTAQYTSVRVVCQNTLSWSLNAEEDAPSSIKIPHSMEFVSNDIKGQLGLMGDGWNQFKEDVTSLSEVRVTKRQAVEFFLEVLGVTEDEAAEGKQLLNAKKLIAFYESGPGSQFSTAKNTTWGLVNAVSYFTDHGRRARNNGTRFNGAAFGTGARLKKTAFSKALKLAKAA